MRFLLLLVLVLVFTVGQAQQYVSTESYIRFYSDGVVEDIEAVNQKGKSVIDISSGEMAFSIPIDAFQFEKELMQEHFNENYLESDKYPKSTFKGVIENFAAKEGSQRVTAIGELTIHGVSRDIVAEGSIISDANEVTIESVFTVRLEDYKIKIPKAVFYNIAEEVEVTIKFTYAPYKK
ncbi:MAG: YceI family protein [Cyclobacteriaceae bacterium]